MILNFQFSVFCYIVLRMINIMAQVKVTQVKSVIDRSKRQKDTMKALGLRKMNQTVIKEVTPQIMGMIHKVKHLITFEHIG